MAAGNLRIKTRWSDKKDEWRSYMDTFQEMTMNILLYNSLFLYVQTLLNKLLQILGERGINFDSSTIFMGAVPEKNVNI